tara:strand:- start:106 stop:441 length:336 start_codon:yes stop_codon:yes gene_type:complete
MAWKQLGQLMPTDTNAASLFSPIRGFEYRVDVIYITEVAGGTATYRVFVDDDGSTYANTTAIVFDTAAVANASVRLEGPFYMNNPAGNIAVRSSIASNITFTAFGVERKVG